jgi:2-phosphosulfolactate phosphatase
MIIEKLITPSKVSEECVIVIDVLRAFTTAAYAFGQGASKILAVKSPEDAFHLKKQFKDALLMGEVHGIPVEGFDFGNSPHEIGQLDLSHRILIQRTSAGTQGVVAAMESKRLFVASFVVAAAMGRKIQQIRPAKATFVVTGKYDGDEDLALADYLEAMLMGQRDVDPQPYLQRVARSLTGQKFQQSNAQSQADLQAALAINRFDFAMEVKREGSQPVIYRVS